MEEINLVWLHSIKILGSDISLNQAAFKVTPQNFLEHICTLLLHLSQISPIILHKTEATFFFQDAGELSSRGHWADRHSLLLPLIQFPT